MKKPNPQDMRYAIIMFALFVALVKLSSLPFDDMMVVLGALAILVLELWQA